MKKIAMEPIGVIHTPYKRQEDIPIQGRFVPEVEGWLELKEKYAPGLKDLDGFTYAMLFFLFDRSDKVSILAEPYLEREEHGIFAIRSPHRPNHIGLSVVKIKNVNNGVMFFTQVDLLDGTPLLDIKPYVRQFDCFPDAVSGWIDKHFQNGALPGQAIHKSKL